MSQKEGHKVLQLCRLFKKSKYVYGNKKHKQTSGGFKPVLPSFIHGKQQKPAEMKCHECKFIIYNDSKGFSRKKK